MKALWNNLIVNEDGMILSAELVIVLTVGVLAIIVGLNHVANAVNSELTDVAQAIGTLNQSYSFTGYHCCPCFVGWTSFTAGSAFWDGMDVGDVFCSGPTPGVGEICNGSYQTGAVGVSSGGVSGSRSSVTTLPSTSSSPVVETPCEDCPPLSAPSSGPADASHGYSHPVHDGRLSPAPVPMNDSTRLPAPPIR